MLCPRCKVDLRPITLKGIEVDTCDKCEGVWFDHGEINKVFTAYGEDLKTSPIAKSLEGEVREEAPAKGELICPECAKVMHRYRYALATDIILDGCEKGCGIWVDDAELGKIFNTLVESHKALEPEKERELVTQLQAIEKETMRREAARIDSMVQLDDKPGQLRLFGEVLQLFHTLLDKIQNP